MTLTATASDSTIVFQYHVDYGMIRGSRLLSNIQQPNMNRGFSIDCLKSGFDLTYILDEHFSRGLLLRNPLCCFRVVPFGALRREKSPTSGLTGLRSFCTTHSSSALPFAIWLAAHGLWRGGDRGKADNEVDFGGKEHKTQVRNPRFDK